MAESVLKGNFKTKNQVEVDKARAAQEKATDPKAIAQARKKQMLDHLGGSMVYVDRDTFTWDGETDAKPKA
ncbi:MAG: hypothetical protein HY928_13590 [Elusimicrobia bacterium]|nr:hypothetical protein [Elusimicrobiota bacterium]